MSHLILGVGFPDAPAGQGPGRQCTTESEPQRAAAARRGPPGATAAARPQARLRQARSELRVTSHGPCQRRTSAGIIGVSAASTPAAARCPGHMQWWQRPRAGRGGTRSAASPGPGGGQGRGEPSDSESWSETGVWSPRLKPPSQMLQLMQRFTRVPQACTGHYQASHGD
jgi:hypothetical protein